jgi:Asp-tRNA(Asn)/Glu-tRNA(Gln) amidotransferase A subunit family amidase
MAMQGDDLHRLSVGQLGALYRTRKLSPVEMVRAALARVERLNPGLNALVLVAAEQALAEAARAEQAYGRGEAVPPLLGVPVTVKDNILTHGMRSTMGSPLFADHVPDADSGVVARARAAGAIIIGKSNTPAFGWTAITDNLLFGPTRNPFDPTLTPGGSSGGGAVATATGMVPIGIGTDGGGSLRTPGAFTGTVGFKPSHGRLPDTPPHPHWIIQHYGPLTRSVADAAAFLDATAGPCAEDPHSLPLPDKPFTAALARPPKALRVLFTTQFGWCGKVDAQIAAACRAVAGRLGELGWQVEERDLHWDDPAPFANVIAMLGLHHRLAPLRHRRADIDDGIQALLETADALPPNAFYEAYLTRNAWCAQPLGLFEEIDLLVTPTTAALPFPVGRFAPATINGEPAAAGEWNPFLRAFNLTGQPAITLPVGKSREGLPIGLQLVGPRFGDALVLAAGAAIEQMVEAPRFDG